MKKLLSIILCFMLCLGMFGCSKSDVQASKYTPLLGELIEATENGDTLSIKVKIKENEDKELTIEQNEFNIENLVVNQGADKFNFIKYTAVMDKDGKETEALSFTVNKETIQNLKDRKINIGTVIARSEDVFIVDSLKNYKTIEQIAEADTTESSDNNSSNYNAIDISTLEVKDVMNGPKTEKIGEYLTVDCDNTKLTDKELIAFYKEYIKDQDYNWSQIMFKGKDKLGLHFTGYMFSYSTIDYDEGVSNDRGTGYIITDEGEDKERVEYEGEDYTK